MRLPIKFIFYVVICMSVVLSQHQTMAQSPPSTQSPGNIALGTNGGVASLNGFLNDATGTPGGSPGFTQFVYGDNSGPGNGLYVESKTTSRDGIKFSTVNSAGNAFGAPTVFNSTTSYTWKVLRNFAVDSQIYIETSDTNNAHIDLTVPANQTAAEARLNAVLVFDASDFRDQNGDLVTGSVGNFFFTLDDFSATRGWQSINVNYAPVPEPATIGLAAFGMLSCLGAVRRFRSGKPASSVVS